MTIAELLLPEVDQEMATAQRVLERVPDDKGIKNLEFGIKNS